MANETVRIVAVSGAGSTGQVRVLNITGTSGGIGQVIISTVQGVIPNAFTVDAGLSQTLDPFQTVELNAVVTSPGLAADSWTWTQTAGPTVLILASGASAKYRAPATMRGTTLTFQVTATLAGNPDVVSVVTHTVRSHSGQWKVTAQGVLYGVERRRKPRAPLTPPQTPNLGVTTSPTRTTSPTLMTQG